jgi:hypothetical protein
MSTPPHSRPAPTRQDSRAVHATLSLPAAFVLLLALSGCKTSSERIPPPPGSASATRSVIPPASARSSAPEAPAPREHHERDEPPELRDAGTRSGDLPLRGLTDVAPAGPAAAHALGIVMVTKKDDVLLARLNAAKATSAFATLDVPAEDLASFGRGPALRSGHAYWISQGRLVRRRFLSPPGQLEVLAEDARAGTRVAASPEDTPVAAVAYVARSKSGAMKARLWTEGGGNVELSPEGTATATVSLAATSSALFAVALEGRTSMSPVHARRIHFEERSVRLEEDVVVWVGGSAQPSTEVTALGTIDNLWAFVPIERDVTTFGLARVEIGATPSMNATVNWRVYPNGMDPSPVNAASVCGAPAVLYVRPGSAEPHAAQELYLAKVGTAGLEPARLIARGRVFSGVSLAAAGQGAVVAYVADHRV